MYDVSPEHLLFTLFLFFQSSRSIQVFAFLIYNTNLVSVKVQHLLLFLFLMELEFCWTFKVDSNHCRKTEGGEHFKLLHSLDTQLLFVVARVIREGQYFYSFNYQYISDYFETTQKTFIRTITQKFLIQ